MGEIFTKRPGIAEYETLTSYLHRISENNGVDFQRVVKYIIPRNSRNNITSRNLCQMDVLPRSIADKNKLSNLIGKDIKCIEAHTFTPVINKLIINESASDRFNMQSLLIKTINTHTRCFCPTCLKDTGIYSLLWQVNGINICDKHFTRLDSVCQNCKKPIEYCSDYINQHRCSHCGFLYLKQVGEKVSEKEIIDEQMYMYRNWKFLLDYEKDLFTDKQGFSKEQMLAMKMLYTSQINSTYLDTNNIMFFGKGYYKNLIKKANGISDNYQIRLHVLLDFFRSMNIDAESFSKILVPDDYFKSVMNYYKKEKHRPVGPCLSPWCKSFKKKETIKQVKGYKFYFDKFELGSVCTECYMKYGYNRENSKWESIDNEVELIWEKVKPLLDNGMTKKEIKDNLEIGIDSVYRIYGYLSFHKLIEDPNCSIYSEDNDNDLIEKFIKIIEHPGDMGGNAYKLYGWSKPKYYYYLADKGVQSFLIFESDHLRKKFGSAKPKGNLYWKSKVDNAINQCMVEGKDININNITEMIGCIYRTLHNYKLDEYISDIRCKQENENRIMLRNRLLSIADNYFDSLKKEGKLANLVKVFEIAGTYDKLMRTKYPDITEELAQKVKKYNDEVIQRKNMQELNLILDAINKLEEDGQLVKKATLAEITGLSLHVINKRLKMLNEE